MIAGPICVPYEDYYHYAATTYEESPFYIFDKRFGDKAPQLVRDYSVCDANVSVGCNLTSDFDRCQNISLRISFLSLVTPVRNIDGSSSDLVDLVADFMLIRTLPGDRCTLTRCDTITRIVTH